MDILEMPFVTQEQKFNYWKASKEEIKELRSQLPKVNVDLISAIVHDFDNVRLVSYAPDGSTCTLNMNGNELYFNRCIENES